MQERCKEWEGNREWEGDKEWEGRSEWEGRRSRREGVKPLSLLAIWLELQAVPLCVQTVPDGG